MSLHRWVDIEPISQAYARTVPFDAAMQSWCVTDDGWNTDRALQRWSWTLDVVPRQTPARSTLRLPRRQRVRGMSGTPSVTREPSICPVLSHDEVAVIAEPSKQRNEIGIEEVFRAG